MSLKDELKSIISGIGDVTKGTALPAIANYIRKSKVAGANAEEKEFINEQKAAILLDYFKSNNFFFTNLKKKGI